MALQEILSALVAQPTNGGGCVQNATAINSTMSQASMTMPTDLSSLIMMLFSFSALRDWLKLIVIGGLLETARRFAFSAYYNAVNSFFITATFEEEDASYSWMMIWLSKQPAWSKAREVQISTRTFGLETMATLVPGEEEDTNSGSNARKLAYLPTVSSSYSMWYKRRWLRVIRSRAETGYYGRKEETLTISIMTRSHEILNDLLREAKKAYTASQENNISIYISDIQNNWRLIASRPKRPLRSIVLDPGIKDLLIEDARDFLNSKSWYTERGIPFRRGYLLYGAPGSGKTSMIHSLAGELGLDVYIISLSRSGMDDTALNELISELPERCIALMEDIDAAFHHGLNRDEPKPVVPNTADGQTQLSHQEVNRPPAPTTTSRLSLSGLLNALDGVGAQEGRILYATTNKYLALDPALCRPGRMDIHVEFRLASKYQAGELYRCFYMPSDETEDSAEDETEKEILESDNGSSADPSDPLIDLETSSQISDSSSSSGTLVSPSPSAPDPEKPMFLMNSHKQRPPKLSKKQISKLAQAFSDAIPEREFSMASLQGYLMVHKTRPFEAVKDIGKWIEKERAEQATKAAAKGIIPPKAELATVEESPSPPATPTA